MQLEVEYYETCRRKRSHEAIWAVFILLLIGVEAYGLYRWISYQPNPAEEIEQYIVEAGRRYDVSPDLIRAVVWQESRFNPNARGKAGEIGLMQLMEASASEWAAAEGVSPFEHELVSDPKTNTLAGTWYLKKRLDRYQYTDNPLPYALADYNAGRGNVLRWNEGEAATNSAAFYRNIDFPITKQYVLHVMERFAYYKTNSANVAN